MPEQTETKPRGRVIAAVVAFALIAGWVIGGNAYILAQSIATPTLPACATEDSSNCFWDAELHGNGEGRSFVDIDGVAFYIDGE